MSVARLEKGYRGKRDCQHEPIFNANDLMCSWITAHLIAIGFLKVKNRGRVALLMRVGSELGVIIRVSWGASWGI